MKCLKLVIFNIYYVIKSLNRLLIKTTQMLRHKLIRIGYRMCQITPEIYGNLFAEFNKKPQLATLGKYLQPSNLL